MALYWRKQGPIAYEAEVLENTAAGYRHFAGELLASGLGWCWQSTPGSTALLSEETGERLVGELLEDIDPVEGHHRHIDLFGADVEAAPRLLGLVVQAAEVRRFCREEPGALRIVWVRLTDKATPLLFTPHDPVPACRRLVEMWVRSGAKKRPYHRLGVARLEALWEMERDHDKR